jgi:hypothetical protein
MNTQTTKIRKDTLRKLRMVYALIGRPMTEIMERLVDVELARVQKKVTTTK